MSDRVKKGSKGCVCALAQGSRFTLGSTSLVCHTAVHISYSLGPASFLGRGDVTRHRDGLDWDTQALPFQVVGTQLGRLKFSHTAKGSKNIVRELTVGQICHWKCQQPMATLA